MAADGMQQRQSSAEYQVHHRNYEGFLTMLRRSTVAVVIVTALVLFLIAH